MDTTKTTTIIKPFLKWVGGKTQIMDELMVYFPNEINNYHEIFLGGGSVLFTVLSYIKNKKIKLTGNIYAYDANEPLIYLYKNIQSYPQELYDEIQKIKTEWNECNTEGNINRKPKTKKEATETKENYYYWIRNEYNQLCDKKTIIGSALFLFLNKTCFRGVFRMGPRGFNVPYGHYSNPEIVNREHLEEIHHLIKNVQFQCCDFSISLCSDNIKKNDYIYLDPPYHSVFVGYTADGFHIDKQTELFLLCDGITEKWMMSNSNTDFVIGAFPENKYKLKIITAKRSINSKNPESKTTELLITNY